MTVIPAINCSDMACVSHRFLVASKFLSEGDWIHLDVADAKFTYNKTWGNSNELEKLIQAHPEFKFKIEVHLMVEEPENQIELWVKAGAKRVIVHLETIIDKKFREKPADPRVIIAKIFNSAAKGQAEVMLSSNPETRIEDFKDWLEYFPAFQILGVKPGLSGQKFLPTVLDKVKFLRSQFPNAKIEVDGGVNLEVARLVKEAGADILTAASFIFDTKDSKRAYESLLGI